MEATLYAMGMTAAILGVSYLLAVYQFDDIAWAWKGKDAEHPELSWLQRNKRRLIAVAVAFVLLTLCSRYLLTCQGSNSIYNADGFNEMTGEFDQQRVIDHFYK